ncbi:alpha/beta family hydrolase [Corallincola platygyrae]|uniref:Alpha/beta family hydrolase n=1 Tax=Corallincola platygyrae TaxID=1193278 RepID=A0ABW4XQL1_9GAMM
MTDCSACDVNPNILVNGAEQPIARLLLAHGAGAGMSHDFMSRLAEALSNQHLEVVRFNFDYMVQALEQQKKRPPDRLPKLVDCMTRVGEQLDHNLPLFVAGKSMGSRVACLVAEGLSARGVIAYGYPFHPPGKPERLRRDELEASAADIFVLQGERDPFGRSDEWSGFQLPEHVSLVAVKDGEHSFKPTKKSGVTQDDNIVFAAEQTARFIKSKLAC